MKRRYTAPTNDQRCQADIAHGKIAKEGARCMKRAVKDGYCRQHGTKYRIVGSGIDLNGWFKFSAEDTETGKVVSLARKRVADLRREGRIIN